MKKILLLAIILFLSFNACSQITFEKGYLIDNSNKKTECLIRNIDWKNNPTEFEYKISENSEPVNATIDLVGEIGINNTSKYVRSTVKIDNSRDELDKLSNEKKPNFVEEQIFLKVLVEGKSNLYFYQNGDFYRYFYKIENSNVEQLVYKRYLISENKIAVNNQFKQQLWNDLKCPTFQISTLDKIEYTENSLIGFFVEYNKCNNSAFKNYKTIVKKDLFNLTFRAHLNNSSLSINNNLSQLKADFGSKSGLGFGVEGEYILPINKNKWAVAFETTYQSYQASTTQTTETIPGFPPIITNYFIDYSSIETPISVRHYLFINNNSKFFINVSFVLVFPLNSTLTYQNNKSLKISTDSHLKMGLGYKFKDKYSLELRYGSRDTFSNYTYWNSKFSTLSLILGYSVF